MSDPLLPAQGSTEDPERPPSSGIADTLADAARGVRCRVKAATGGRCRSSSGCSALAMLFGTLERATSTPRGTSCNLLLQMAGYTMIAMGVVFVLLIAEIDLSVAFVSGVAGVVMALHAPPGRSPTGPGGLRSSLALGATTAIGLLHGLFIAKARVPSFVVTLAWLLAWSGVVLILTTEATTRA